MRSFSPGSIELSTQRGRRARIVDDLRPMVAALTMVVFVTQSSFAQATKKPVVEEKTLVTQDNFDLKISYFKSVSGKDAPVVVMLHGKHGSRQQWKGLATDLQTKGDFAVVTVDLRGHGESPLPKKAELKKIDYLAMVAMDMEAVKQFLFDEHQKGQLNMNKLGIVACDFSAAVALVYTEFDWEKIPYDDSPTDDQRTPRGQDVQALALISPDLSTPGLLATKSVSALRGLRRPLPVMIGVSEKNGRDVTAANKLYDLLTSKKDKEKDDHLYFEKYESDLRGMDLVTQNAMVRGHIFAFLLKHVKEHQSEWRDRRSRLDRD